jgi:glutathione S-transferase
MVDAGRTYVESSVIIERVSIAHPGPVQLIPREAGAALEVRMMDRFFDNYVMTPMQKIVADHIRDSRERDPLGVQEARTMLETAYAWLNGALAGRIWACGSEFSMADCAAAPSLFFSDWVHEIGERFPEVRGYRRRLLARASVARAVDEGRPYRELFPPGAPNRD